jgi:hypothetical protein
MKAAAMELKRKKMKFTVIIDDAQRIVRSSADDKESLILVLQSLVEDHLADVILVFSEESEISGFNEGNNLCYL